MSDWGDGFNMTNPDDWSGWSSGDFGGGSSSGGGWNSGYDLPGGGDTGGALQPGSSFEVGPGQIPSDIYQQLINLGGLSPGMDTNIPGGGKGGAAAGSTIASLLKSLGLTNSAGDANLASILGLLGTAAGGYMNYNATGKATQQMTDAVNKANETITSLLGPSAAAFKPYSDMGAAAVGKLQALPQSNLAANFGPLGAGRGIGGPTSFASLMKKGG
jgi:hypothetical protein